MAEGVPRSARQERPVPRCRAPRTGSSRATELVRPADATHGHTASTRPTVGGASRVDRLLPEVPVRALVRGGHRVCYSPWAMIYAFGEFELDEARGELRRAGALVPLEPKPFAVLRHLIRHRQRVVSKPELLQRVWPERRGGGRLALGCDPQGPAGAPGHGRGAALHPYAAWPRLSLRRAGAGEVRRGNA